MCVDKDMVVNVDIVDMIVVCGGGLLALGFRLLLIFLVVVTTVDLLSFEYKSAAPQPLLHL